MLGLDDVTFQELGPGGAAGSEGDAGRGGDEGASSGSAGGGAGGSDGGSVEGIGGNLGRAGVGGTQGAAGTPSSPSLVFDHYSFARGPAAFEVAAASGLTSNDVTGGLGATAGTFATVKGGQVVLAADGGFAYTPPSPRFWGDDGFSYGVGTLSMAVRLAVQPGAIELSDIELGEGSGFGIASSTDDDFAGSFVADAGDVNGDGLADILVAAPHAGSNEGVVYVVFGKTDRASVSLDVISGPSPAGGFAIFGLAVDDCTGRQVSSAGDVNGDGLADILVGTAEGDRTTGDGTGIAYVVFGKASASPIFLEEMQATNEFGFAIYGAAAGDSAGRTLSGIGDFDGDELADVAIGALFADRTGTNDGAAYVVFGKTNGDPVELLDIEAGAEDQGIYFSAIAGGDFTGSSIAGGDVNGDELGDVIIGAQDGDLGGTDSGQVYVIFGRLDPDSMSLAAIDGGFTIIGTEPSDAFGRTAAVARDINGDGRDDVLIGGGSADPGNSSVRIVFGKTSEDDVDIGTLAADATGASLEGVVLDTQNVPGSSNFTGLPVSPAGDIDGDGLGDVIVGAYGTSFPGRALAGAANVVLGRASPSSLDLASLDGASGSPGFAIRGRRAFDVAGFSVSGGGDVNGDGLADLVVGAPGADGDSPGSVAYVLFGWDVQGALAARAVPVAAP
jgi:hypothetical protein